MASLRRLTTIFVASVLIAGGGACAALADSGHARIVRLSLVQGDVRFARDVKGDALTESRANWEVAAMNLPIRQGYVVATDNGRAEVEFENGAMAFLAENTVLEFYDLSSEDGGFTTRLILRQGSAEFYVNPGSGDYFSVTGGDFSVQAESKTTFRMNNYDDGTSVNVLHGRLTAIANRKNTLLEKDQSLSLKAGEPDSMVVERVPPNDEFDQWVSGRIDSVSTASNAAMQYSNSYGAASGFGDLYTYGAWFPLAGYGYGWRPYGVGFGWCPFDFGSWYYDPFFGWSFLGSQPWGWAPYHYGGWLFQPGIGWVWSPAGAFGGGGIGRWRPVTGVWLRNSTGTVAIVPSHPLDVKGKTPLNLTSGAFEVSSRGATGALPVASSTGWKVENKPARDLMQNQLAEVAAPVRVARTMAASAGALGTRIAAGSGSSTIVYDRAEHRFVNAENVKAETQANVRNAAEQVRTSSATEHVPAVSERVAGREGQNAAVPSARSAAPPRPAIAPPNVPRAVVTERVFNASSGGGSSRGGSGSSSRGFISSGSSGSSSGARSSGGGGGGRPH
jgi:uncharacterized protein DUF6600/FecR-like protein